MEDHDAASALLSLVNPEPRYTSPAKRVPLESKNTTPEKPYRLSGVKRNGVNEFIVTYTSDDMNSFSFPVHRGDTCSLFAERRSKAAKVIPAPKLTYVYVSWLDSVNSINIEWRDWTLFHKTVHQERFQNGVLQLIVQRNTCQTSSHTSVCRSCSNPNWRTGCERIKLRYFIMPMLTHKAFSMEAVHIALTSLNAVASPISTKYWKDKLPQLAVRTTNLHI